MYLAVYLSSHLKKKAINLKKNIYTLTKLDKIFIFSLLNNNWLKAAFLKLKSHLGA